MAEKCLLERSEIQSWVEEHGGAPGIIKGTDESDEEGGEMLYIIFGNAGRDMEVIDWDEFFDRFENENLALVFDDELPPSEFRFFDRAEAVQEFFPDKQVADPSEEFEMMGHEYSGDEEDEEDEEGLP